MSARLPQSNRETSTKLAKPWSRRRTRFRRIHDEAPEDTQPRPDSDFVFLLDQLAYTHRQWLVEVVGETECGELLGQMGFESIPGWWSFGVSMNERLLHLAGST